MKNIEKRGFPCSVRSNDGMSFPRLNLQTDVMQSLEPTKKL
jgi:hypothetical protein